MSGFISSDDDDEGADAGASARGIVDVRWLFDFASWQPTAAEFARLLELIEPSSERDKIMKYSRGESERGHANQDARSSLANRLCERRLFWRAARVPASRLPMARTATGKPFVDVAALRAANAAAKGDADVELAERLVFNASHQGRLVAFAATSRDVRLGIDVMEMALPRRPTRKMLEFFANMRDCFTAAEWATIRRAVPSSAPADVYVQDAVNLFYVHWSLKESYIKAIGIGLGFELQRASFTLEYPAASAAPPALPHAARLAVDGRPLAGWRFQLSYIVGEDRCSTDADGDAGDVLATSARRTSVHVMALCIGPREREGGARETTQYGTWDFTGEEAAAAAAEVDAFPHGHFTKLRIDELAASVLQARAVAETTK